MPADDIDIGQPWRGSERGAHAGVVQETELTQARGLVGRRLRIGGVADRVIDDFTESGADRRHRRHGARRQVAGGLPDTLGHELAGAKDIGTVRKDERDLRETRLGERPELYQARQARELGLQRDGDA